MQPAQIKTLQNRGAIFAGGFTTENQNRISENFNIKSLLMFALPTIAMMIFTSLYNIVDGIFISRFVNTDALAAINVVMPYLILISCVGFLFGMGGSALVGKQLGEGKNEEARQNFSMIVVTTFAVGIIVSALCLVFMDDIMSLLGASEKLYGYCISYARILTVFITLDMAHMMFNSMFVAAGKPGICLWLTLSGGVANIIFDWLFIAVFGMGIEGAAYGTAIGYFIGGGIPVFYFFGKHTNIYFVKFKLKLKTLAKCVSNGISEMVNSVASSITCCLCNHTMLAVAGEDGIAAYSAVMYTNFVFVAIFIGFVNGCAPIFSYNYGAENTERLKNLFRSCVKIIGVITVLLMSLAYLLSRPAILAFCPPDSAPFPLALHGYRVFLTGFVFVGFNIFASALFTALSNGKISAIVSFARTLVFQIAALLILPRLMGIDGIWLAGPLAEFLSMIMSVYFIVRYRKTYKYF